MGVVASNRRHKHFALRSDKGTQEKIDVVESRLIRNFGDSESSATTRRPSGRERAASVGVRLRTRSPPMRKFTSPFPG